MRGTLQTLKPWSPKVSNKGGFSLPRPDVVDVPMSTTLSTPLDYIPTDHHEFAAAIMLYY
jgi:hypothetical protein